MWGVGAGKGQAATSNKDCTKNVNTCRQIYPNSNTNITTRCNFTQRPRVANCVRVRTCACSAARALETRG